MPRADLRAPAAFAFCAVVWGSTWLAIKVGYGGLGAVSGAALRFGLAAALLGVLLLALRWPRPTAFEWKLGAMQAVLLYLLDYGLIYVGEQHVDSGLTAVLFAAFPLFTAVAGHALREERLTGRKAGGIVLGLGGLAVVFADSLVFDPSRAWAMGLIVAAALTAGVNTVLMHRHTHGLHPGGYTFTGMVLGALVLQAAALALGEPLALPRGTVAWASVLYLSAVGSVAAFLLYFWLLQQWGPSKTSLLILLTPLVALALGAALLGEHVTWTAAAGTLLVLAGLWTTLRAPAGKAPEPVVAVAARHGSREGP